MADGKVPEPADGSGGVGVMRQFIGSMRDATTVQEFLVRLAPPSVREAWDGLEAAEIVLMERDDERAQFAYAHALTDWADAGGNDPDSGGGPEEPTNGRGSDPERAGEEQAVELVAGEELVVRALVHHAPVVDEHDPMGEPQGGATVGDEDRGAIDHELAQGRVDRLFGGGVDG